MVATPSQADQLHRCAIYTRKSASVGLDKPLNSLATQRGVCAAYIRSQAHRNWVEVPQHYDDGGYSGGTLMRPALQSLLNDIEAGRVDIVVIYKVDRLSRSLTDFVRLMEVLDKYGASFVSVTQTFDTSDSMGRLVLNILLTFAQFERELASERIRDRCAAQRAKGLFAGGMPPIGYLVRRTGKLVPDPDRAETVRNLFLDFATCSAAELGRRLEAQNFKTLTFGYRHGNRNRRQRFPAGNILKILRNPLYAGYFRHNGKLVKSQIEPLVTMDQWASVQDVIANRYPRVRDPITSPLLGILHDEVGRPLTISRGRGGRKVGRYYISEAAGWARGHGVRRIHVRADRVEKLTIRSIEDFLIDRTKLRQAILSLGLYSNDIAKLLQKGQLAARRLSSMDNAQLREFLVALVSRADVTRTQLQLLINCYELSRFLAWDGNGVFKRTQIRPKGTDRFRMIYVPAALISTRPEFVVPIARKCASSQPPNPQLVQLLESAAALRQFTLTNRDKSLSELAGEKKMGSRYFCRLLRLNYLAPDIQTAIMDGSQPADLTPRDLVFSALPTDWGQQRRLYGFPSA